VTALDAIVPFGSVLVGAAITYWLNVRTGRKAKMDDILHDTIAAVSVAAASSNFITEVPPWKGVTEADYAAFSEQLGREASHDFVRAVAAARAAVARASAYVPELRAYATGDIRQLAFQQADEITAILRRTLAE
jgi:hypothetical protein